jgi:hypothetical protein
LHAVSDAITPLLRRPNHQLGLLSVGIGKERVDVGTSACAPAATTAVLRWFELRYGDTVTVDTCQSAILARPAIAPVRN